MTNNSAAYSAVTRYALDNRAVHFVFDKAGTITSVGYTVGNVILMAKDGLSVSFDTAAGASFLTCSMAMKLTDRWPVMGFRVVGGFCLLGSGFLAVDAMNIATDLPLNTGKLTGAAMQGVTASLLLFQHEISGYADSIAQRPRTVFNKVAAKVLDHPVLMSAAVDFASGAGLLVGAMTQYDPGMLAAMSMWCVGIVGLIGSDQKLRAAHYNVVASNAALKPS